MASWLNFNESINSIKGQITNLANTVLAEEEDIKTPNSCIEEYRKLCAEKDRELEDLRTVNEQLQRTLERSAVRNGNFSEDNWDWIAPDAKQTEHEDVSTLKKAIEKLENEKSDLINQLEQLDVENQQNLAELVAIREKLQDENLDLKDKNAQLRQQNKSLISREEKLKQEVEEFKTKAPEQDVKALRIINKTLEENISSLRAEVANLTQELDQAQTLYRESEKADQLPNHQELTFKLDETLKELSVLRTTHDTLKKTYQESLLSSDKELKELQEKLRQSESENHKVYNQLQNALQLITEAEQKRVEDAENCQKLAFILESYEQQVSSLKKELASAKRLQPELDKALEELNQVKQCPKDDPTVDQLQQEINKLTKTLEEKITEQQNMHKTYVNIITESIRQCASPNEPSNPVEPLSTHPELKDFQQQVQNICKMLLEFKEKCESLEKDLVEASQEKTKILNEKYEEIEKLLKNQEDLSQEITNKEDTVKKLEEEVASLIDSNDVLLSELDGFKSPVLETISETNEESIILLESDLEHANKRIRELEDIIDSPSRTPVSNDPSSASLEERVGQKHQDYQELLNSFDELKLDYEDTALKLKQSKQDMKVLAAENEELKAYIEKLKSDLENNEYQLTEANILRDEQEELKRSLEHLRAENKELKLQSMKSIDLKSELMDIKEKWVIEENLRRELEIQVKNLTEKLQNYKMSETSLKLQYDTLSKDHQALQETKINLEESLGDTKQSLEEYDKSYTELLEKYDGILLRCEDLNTKLHEKETELEKVKNNLENHMEAQQTVLISHEEEIKLLNETLKALEEKNYNLQELLTQSTQDLEALTGKEQLLQEKLKDLEEKLKEQGQPREPPEEVLKQKDQLIEQLQQQLQELANSRNELINMITVKHQENVNYHNEIQRLSEIIQSEAQKYSQLETKLIQAGAASDEIAKKTEQIDQLTDENNFLKEKCDLLAKNLLEEQAKVQKLTAGPSEKELSLSKQIDRLQKHLMEMQEHHTQELLQIEQKNVELQARINDLELREKNSSTMYTSVSIRANQQVESLQNQLQTLTSQRDELRIKLSEAEDVHSKQAAALANLQFVLEQFQKDREKDVHKETERIRRQINVEKQVQETLKKEIENLKCQLEDSKVGLQAASRLSDQLEHLKKQNLGLKDEVSQLQQKLSKTQQTVQELTSQTDGKIDKSLIKSLLVGFLSTGNTPNWNKDQIQVLKLIATVLDFNQQDHDKVKLNKPQQGSWLGSLLHPQPANQSQNISQESLSQAFIRFLENESKPRNVPSLLSEQTSKRSAESSRRSTPRTTPSPIVLNEVVLPTFADFGQNRNSSSILKDVLKDNNNS
ncbi:thyroid receptor-interacting protein 11-like [Anthonomus grandis grandis]|uniref:thyroid receptor-interacting protein 11-like n=1 Tax=Anthonomus grandis grandis TaxID=2921223 RepID=UPI002165F14A|nr:thyroid receptor-interacting protein 11-like [Anthonomus grandis grandis]